MERSSALLLVGGGAVAGALAPNLLRFFRKGKPAIPWTYQIPEVWTYEEGKMQEGSNRPTSGARKEQTLKKGDHDLQLYSLGTPNGCKVTIMLEELNQALGVEYDAWKISFKESDQFGSDFVKINPNSKIPAMLDYSFDEEKPVRVFESASILKYLAEKYDSFLVPTDLPGKTECFNWLIFQVGGGPYMGGAGFGFWYRSAPYKFKFAIDRATIEVKRQLDVLDKELATKKYLCGDQYSIADIALWPWIRSLKNADTFLSFSKDYPHLVAWFDTIKERPAVKRGIRVTGFGDDAVPERHSKDDFIS